MVRARLRYSTREDCRGCRPEQILEQRICSSLRQIRTDKRARNFSALDFGMAMSISLATDLPIANF